MSVVIDFGAHRAKRRASGESEAARVIGAWLVEAGYIEASQAVGEGRARKSRKKHQAIPARASNIVDFAARQTQSNEHIVTSSDRVDEWMRELVTEIRRERCEQRNQRRQSTLVDA
jgi:hypothetical protein